MYRPRRRNAAALWILIGVAALYGFLLSALRTITGNYRLDASIGVILGLYICSRPAGNLIDLVFFGRVGGREVLRGRALAWWLVLNGLVLLAGYLVLSAGAIRFARP